MKTLQRIQLHSLLVVLLGLIGVTLWGLGEIRKSQAAEIAAICSTARSTIARTTFAAAGSELSAKAAYVYDFTNNQTVYAKNERKALPLASLTKLMTLRLALTQHPAEYEYKIIPKDLETEGSIGFVAGDTYALGEIAKAALVASSNNAAVMLAHSTGRTLETFIAHMNAEARALDLTSLSYQSVSGLDAKNDTEATALGSASDVLTLLALNYADYPEVIESSTHRTDTVRSVDGKTIAVTNTNKALSSMPLLVASKTGYTDTAGGNLAVLWKDKAGKLFGAAVLGSTEAGRFEDTVRLYRTTDVYLSSMESLSSFCN